MGGYNVAIPDPGVVYDLRTLHRYDQETAMIAVHISGPQKKTPKPFPISFNLVKVQVYHIVNEFYYGSYFV